MLERGAIETLGLSARFALDQRRADCFNFKAAVLVAPNQVADIFAIIGEAFLNALFALADDLDVEADQKRGFAIGDNELRIHWLLNRLVTERFDLDERDRIYRAAMDNA